MCSYFPASSMIFWDHIKGFLTERIKERTRGDTVDKQVKCTIQRAAEVSTDISVDVNLVKLLSTGLTVI